VPYVGNFVGGLLAILLTFVSSGGTAALIVVVILLLAQVVENYLFEPLVVGRSVDLSPLMTVFAIVALGTVWGVAGAVLALPLTAMIRVASEHVPRAKPVASLMKSDE
jgi:predicted PurR-regulated permease PerM